MSATEMPEPWLRGTLTEVPPVPRGTLHALELAKEDLERWCGQLTDEQVNARPCGVASVAFHIRHLAGSVDRLLTYAEGSQLNAGQLATLQSEMAEGATKNALFAQFDDALRQASRRIRALASLPLETQRKVGRKGLPTTVGGLLVHIADHTQRHVGQAITTVKFVSSMKS
jgi:hypothetical protein